MILDDEVEQIRGAQLDRRIERPPVERLLDGAEDRGQLFAALLTEQAAGLPSTLQCGAQAGHEIMGDCESEPERLCLRTRWRFGQAALVVLKEQPPSARVVLHDVEHSRALTADELVTRERAGQQALSLIHI